MIRTLARAGITAGLFLPAVAFAAFDSVILTANAVISAGGVTVSVSGSAPAVESLVVNANTFTLHLQAGSKVTLSAPGMTLGLEPAFDVTSTCTSGVITKVISASVAATVLVTPSNTACDSAGSGGGNVVGLISGGGGGGGGGGQYIPPVTTPVVPSTSVPTPATGLNFSSDFGIGASGADVIALQTYLESKGFLTMPAGVAKGTFGGLTRAALRTFQGSVNITPATGYVGPKTRAHLTPSAPAGGLSFSSDFGIGAEGADVVALQTYLESKGFLTMPPGIAKGTFGGLTRAALRTFQGSVNITPATGYVGPKTRAHLNSQ